MAEVHRIPNRDEAEREASEWIARLNADDVSSEDRARFEIWRSAHPRHARAYEALSATWQELVKLGPLVRAVSFGQAMNAATSPFAPRRRGALVAVAASVVGLVAAEYWWQLKAETLFQTAIGEHASVSLPDGSFLELNSNSLARMDYTERARVIHLERGEAFFKVVHDTQRPFWVVAGHSWVRAVGTTFNVYLRSAGVEVTVSEGTVKVAGERSGLETPSDTALGGGASVSILNAGEQVDVGGHAAVIRELKPAQLKRFVAWRQGVLYFENQPLGDVVEEMSRYTTLKIEISDASLRRLPIGGAFRANQDGAEALLTMLQEGLGLAVRRDGHERALIEDKPVQ